MKVWLDDSPERDPGNNWHIVRNADMAIELLQTGEVEMISLDHDLNDFRQEPYPMEITGAHVVKWMINNHCFPMVINVHSMNRDPSKRMVLDLLKFNNGGSLIRKWEFDKNTASDLEEELSELKDSLGDVI